MQTTDTVHICYLLLRMQTMWPSDFTGVFFAYKLFNSRAITSVFLHIQEAIKFFLVEGRALFQILCENNEIFISISQHASIFLLKVNELLLFIGCLQW